MNDPAKLFLLVLLAVLPACSKKKVTVDPTPASATTVDSHALLREMSTKLAKAKPFSFRTKNVSYAGTGTANTKSGPVKCHRITLEGDLVDAELWLAGDDFLPRRLVATLKDGSGHVAGDVQFHEWNLAAPAADFKFVPPADAVGIDMVSIEESKGGN